jgi:5-(carboxyamino)imidazole ribonucleotide synthase
MMIPPAIELGIELGVLCETDDSSARPACVAVGDYRDWDTVVAFSKQCDVITFDHEHVPQDVLKKLEASGVAVRPGSLALIASQDKIVMREKLQALGAPLPLWAVANNRGDVKGFLAQVSGAEIVAKTPRGGYDGKGVRFISDATSVDDWLGDGPVLLEEKVSFDREVAQLVARRPSGEMAAWPLVETRQSNGVCATVIAPAPVDSHVHQEAEALATTIAEGLGVTGVLAVEMFVLDSGELKINELAMRPHNSGHVFTEFSMTSQFEQHLRAVLDLPLGSTQSVAPHGVMVNLFGGVKRDAVGSALEVDSAVKVHDYGKTSRPGRKAGHVSVIGSNPQELLAVANQAASTIAVDGLA